MHSGGPTLEIAQETVGSAQILTPKGDVDMARSPVLRKAIGDAMKSGAAKVVLDLSGVPYMDSSGLATLVEALQNSRKSKIELLLCALTPRVRSILEIARLNTVFRIHESRDAAIAG
jgi:anti-sigma B factor antagonist